MVEDRVRGGTWEGIREDVESVPLGEVDLVHHWAPMNMKC